MFLCSLAAIDDFEQSVEITFEELDLLAQGHMVSHRQNEARTLKKRAENAIVTGSVPLWTDVLYPD
jgi:hypothetical protein